MTEPTRREGLCTCLGLATLLLPRQMASQSAPKLASLGSAASLNIAGDNCRPKNYGGGTQAQAIANWQKITRRKLAVRRTYFKSPPAGGITTDLQADVQANRKVALSFMPAYNPVSATDRANLKSFLSSCSQARLAANVTLYHEPAHEGLTARQYKAMIAYYGPTVRKHYPLNYSGEAGTGGAIPANYRAYYTSGAFDRASVDFYCRGYVNGARLDDYTAVTDPDNLPFGMWEFGLNEAVQTKTQGTAFYDYITDFFTRRLAAGHKIGYVCHFTASPPSTLSDPAFAAGDHQIGLYQALYDSL